MDKSAMSRRNTRKRPEEVSDPTTIAIQAPQRILELKKERDERARAIVVQAEIALSSMTEQASAYQKQRHRQRASEKAERLRRVTDLIDRRRQIEIKMVEVVTRIQDTVHEVESLMLTGCKGREKEAQQALKALTDKHHPIQSMT
ncbi:uncharacterized protein UV8b_02925 [Ustilaginoidea virens]|uniref:Uncharacterized protein n=1 Tax=Ustilaginoidea virens TaxID=1159556 RepID=A0A8E5HNP2_USTVR|nr:uncharacterized protein UV8b_02925 [Ustilaginoidea virens]QUC18684.1 hypothetical protein UV8b_02925 [Ustilaginoidea virens]